MRLFDTFEMICNGYHYIRNNLEDDWSFITEQKSSGTQIIMRINRNALRQIIHVFRQYQDEETLDFVKTDLVIELAKHHRSRLIARSQAKRVCANLHKFKHVTLDFKNIEAVGQGFVDQVFRVYKNQHGNLELDYINANDDVRFMIERGLKHPPNASPT